MNGPFLSTGTLVSVISYGPFFGRKGTIRVLDIIGEDGPSPVAFYLVVLQEEPGKELWLEHDAVAVVAGTTSSAAWSSVKARESHPKRPSEPAASTQFTKKLIMVIEQDEEIGIQFVQMIRKETPFQAILATSLQHVHRVLASLKCDLLLLVDDTSPEEDLERLYLFPEDGERTRLLNLTFLSCTYNFQDKTDVKSLVKAVNLHLSVRGSPPDGLSTS